MAPFFFLLGASTLGIALMMPYLWLAILVVVAVGALIAWDEDRSNSPIDWDEEDGE